MFLRETKSNNQIKIEPHSGIFHRVTVRRFYYITFIFLKSYFNDDHNFMDPMTHLPIINEYVMILKMKYPYLEAKRYSFYFSSTKLKISFYIRSNSTQCIFCCATCIYDIILYKRFLMLPPVLA